MVKTGVFREIDKLGRVVIPMEIRKTLNIKEGDPIEFSLNGGDIVLHPIAKRCYLCNSEKDLLEFGGKQICRECTEKIKGLY